MPHLNAINNDLGCSLSHITFDGKIKRFSDGKSSGEPLWAIGHEWNYKDKIYRMCFYGDWRKDLKLTWKSFREGKGLDQEFIKSHKQAMDELNKKVEEEREKKFQESMAKWNPIFDKLPKDAPVFPYLDEKKIDSNYTARVYNDLLLIPSFSIVNDIIIAGYQKIYKDNGRWEKRYVSGTKKKGSFCPIGEWKEAPTIAVCEGYATGCSINMALKIPVIVAWDCGNIKTVCEEIYKFNPKTKMIICADNDPSGIGEKKAAHASEAINNCSVVIPMFKNPEGKTDFNDLHQAEGLDEVKRQIMQADSSTDPVVFLGHHDRKFYYFSNQDFQLYDLAPNAHDKLNLAAMAPVKFWASKCSDALEIKGDKVVVNWFKIAAELFQIQSRVGFFNPSRIRGKGCWLDEGKLIVNLGKQVFYENELKPIENMLGKTKYFYEASAPINLAEPATNTECDQMVNTFKKLLYKNKHDYICLIGFIMFSQIAGALKWRPHIWITGPAGCGKTHILKYISNLIYLNLSTDNATAAGIRQKIQNNFNTVVYDESEPDQGQTSGRMNQVLNLMREVSTIDGGSIRGTQSGKAIQYNTSANFCFGSIQASSLSVADSSRIYLIEMLPTAGIQSREDFMAIDAEMAKMVGLAPKLFSRMVKNYAMFVENLEVCKMIIAKENFTNGTSRQLDQFAPFIAGYWAAISTDGISSSFIKECIDALRLRDSENFKAGQVNQADELVDCILEKIIDSKDKKTIGYYIDVVKNSSEGHFDAEKILEAYGIKIKKDGNLFINHTNTELINLLRNTRYSDLGGLLRRSKYLVKPYDTQRIGLKQPKGITLNLDKIIED